MDPLEALRPLASLQQSIHTTTDLSALALSSLRRPPPPPRGSPPPDDFQLEWLISIGLARDGEKDKWWQAKLDLAAVERVFTVENCAILPKEMPSKIKLAWDSGELMLEGLEGALAGEGEGDEKVQLLIQIAQDVRLSVELPPVLDGEPMDIPWLKLMTRWANPYTSSTSNALAAASAQTDLEKMRKKLDSWKGEVLHWKKEAAEAEKKAAEAARSGASQSQSRGGSQGGASGMNKSPKKGNPTTTSSSSRIKGPRPKQSLFITNDDENGGFPMPGQSDED